MIGDLLPLIRQQLEPISDTASLDAQVLVAHILDEPRAWVLAHPEATLTEEQERNLSLALSRLVRGEPLPYLLGEWEFFGLSFQVTPAVLIPRPETELLVEHALQWLQSHPFKDPLLPDLDLAGSKSALLPSHQLSIIDVGTGSGCIAISLAASLPGISVLATDLSRPALEIARHNKLRHHVAGQVCLLQSDLLCAFLPQPVFHLICANLPYIPRPLLPNIAVCDYEPSLALDGGPDGLTLIERLLTQAASCLAPGGLLLLEIEASQGQAVLELARQSFPSATTCLIQDLSGLDRLVSIQLPE
jgi:release factor glutamine methyltransferase